jgi:hypothetical protein
MTTLRCAATAAALFATASVRAGAPPICEKLLPVAAVERATGVSPLRVAGLNEVKYGGGTCNYAQGDKMVLLVTVDEGAGKWEKEYKATFKGSKPVAGVGDEAFSAGEALYFKKGNTVVGIGRFVNFSSGKLYLDDAKLLAVARDIAAKL